jgi:hypothetical protein
MKFAMYLIDLENGTVVGTNDTENIERVITASAGYQQFLTLHSTNGDIQRYGEDAEPIEALDLAEYGLENDEDAEEGDDNDD